MERVGTLINKLQEQLNQHADVQHLTLTAQMLLAELKMLQPQATVNGSKVSVVMPTPLLDSVTQIKQEPVEIVMVEAKHHHAKHSSHKKDEQTGWLFDPLVTIPTLAHQEQREVYELNDVMVAEGESLNDALKEERREVASTIKEAPVRDLKKAIGINDRYRFIRELFREDENMYERSIKTINSFNIFAEAEYWIQREMKVKLGWDDSSETVQMFDQLVKRRFS